MFHLINELIAIAFNSSKVLLEPATACAASTSDKSLSILLKSYWNEKHFDPPVTIPPNLSILLKSYWNQTYTKPFVPASAIFQFF